MTERMAMIPVWIMLAAAFGLIIGWACGELVSQRDCAEEKVEDLRAQLKHAPGLLQERELREMRSVLNDAHKHILAVSKGLEKQPR